MGRLRGPIPILIVDTSAILAVFLLEPEHEAIEAALAAAEVIEMSAATYVELGTVFCRRHPSDPVAARRRMDAYLTRARVGLAPFDAAQARVAVDARIRFGKGLGGPGKLNLGDTYAYALAKVRNAPLLYVGDDFNQTDIASALA